MKANLKKMLGLATLSMSLVINTAPTWAGISTPHEVAVGDTWGQGSLTGARASADSTQYVGCSAHVSNSGTWTTCSAVDKTGKGFLCGGSNSIWFYTVLALTDSSFVAFSGPSNYGDCDYISIQDGSMFLK